MQLSPDIKGTSAYTCKSEAQAKEVLQLILDPVS